jgi:uncharacterized protein
VSCLEYRQRLDAYVDGELDLPGALALEAHTEACARCRAALAKQRALRAAMRRHVQPEPAPASLRARVQDRFGARGSDPRPAWRWAGLAAAAPGIAALALVAWLGFSGPQALWPANESGTRVVYHITSSATPGAALRNVANHLSAAPDVRLVVVAHNEGIDFLLRGARDESGQLLEPAISLFRERGVEFRICSNTLERRGLDRAEVIPGATLVPSGIAEIGRLQSREGYVYLRL